MIPSVLKKKAGRPRVDATSITVRCPPHLVKAIDDFRAKIDPPPTRPEAIRRALYALKNMGGLD